jgi:hypothetical protein
VLILCHHSSNKAIFCDFMWCYVSIKNPAKYGLEPYSTGFRAIFCGAQEGTRTPTTLRSPAPEAGASTNFATWACPYYRGMGVLRSFQPDLQAHKAFLNQAWWFDTVALFITKIDINRYIDKASIAKGFKCVKQKT